MADHGFTIENNLKQPSRKVHLNILSFLSWREQLTAAEVKQSQTIESMRVHAECVIQKVKTFKEFRNKIQSTLNGSANQLWTVCCLLYNYLPPLIQHYNHSQNI